MSSVPPETQTKAPISIVRRLLVLHRSLGLVSALFVLLLSLTGLLLQHSSGLNLDRNFTGSEFWLSWYGIEAAEIQTSFRDGEATASLIAQRLYFNSTWLKSDVVELAGLKRLGPATIIASSNRIFILDDDAQLVEELGPVHGVPGSISAMAVDEAGTLLLQTTEGVISADLENLVFERLALPPQQINWGLPERIDSITAADIIKDYRQSLLTWERVILDIHSGRFLGRWGSLLMDIMAVIFMIMAITGVWLWSRRRSRNQAS